MKQLYVAANRLEADLICNELRSLGFDAMVQGDLLAIPSSPFPSVWVSDDEAERAAKACKTILSANNIAEPPV